MKRALVLLASVALLGSAACSNMNDTEQRTLSGGAIGAGGGALFSAIVGGNPLVGAVVGGAGGAAVGALTSKGQAFGPSDKASNASSGNTMNGGNVARSQSGSEMFELTKNVQSGLTKLGYNPGSADGVSGPKTRAAIREYEAHKNLPVDGRVSRELWLHIKDDLQES